MIITASRWTSRSELPQVAPTMSTLGSALTACERVSRWRSALFLLHQAVEDRHRGTGETMGETEEMKGLNGSFMGDFMGLI